MCFLLVRKKKREERIDYKNELDSKLNFRDILSSIKNIKNQR